LNQPKKIPSRTVRPAKGYELWASDFGDAYNERNQVDWRDRMPFWIRMMDKTGARSVFEMGCNAGWNLSCIRRMYPEVTVYGNDVNTKACEQAWAAGLNAVSNRLDFTLLGLKAELVFTAGVLIHIETEFLPEVMQKLVETSYRYVLAVEYESDAEEAVEYRGYSDKLFKRPYGRLYEDMGLRLVDTGPAAGFDRCTYWLLEK
jgi:pseudaminic acid biosynthesis-associated methylase